MSDPKKDWLEEELANHPDLEAPRTLLPNVMKRVHQRARKPWWARPAEFRSDLWHSFVLAISLLMTGLLLVVNPAQLFSQVPGASSLLGLIPLLAEAAKAVLSQVKVFNFSVLALLAPAIVLSYLLLVATACAIQRLASTRR
jgi:hypothetical protein